MWPRRLNRLDRRLIKGMHNRGIPILRIALGIVFLWFGMLKILGFSPVTSLIAGTYSFFPSEFFIPALGILEVVIGLGLIFKLALRTTLALLWIQLIGTIISPLLNPAPFIANGNPFLLTMEGEFVVKNLVLIAAGIVIGGHEVKTRIGH